MSVASLIATVAALIVLLFAVAWEPINDLLGLSRGTINYSADADAQLAGGIPKPRSDLENANAGTCPFGYSADDAAQGVVRYVASPSDANLQFPVIDISSFRADAADGADDGKPLPPGHQQVTAARQRAAAAAIHDALTTTGFFFVTGHGLTEAERQTLLRSAQQFFALTTDVKRAIPIGTGGFTRGYVGVGGESGSHRLEVKEAFSYGYNWPIDKPRDNALTGPNVWPPLSATDDSPTGLSLRWRDSLIRFYDEMVSIAETVVKPLGMALSGGTTGAGDPATLQAHTERGFLISLMRLFHYFPYQTADTTNKPATASAATLAAERIGSSPHTDWGFLTLIVQDAVGGLQLFTDLNATAATPMVTTATGGQRGRWVDIPVVDGGIVLNCGDYLSLLTGGKFKSPLHRVVIGDEQRYSAVFFYYPNFEAKIEPLGGSTESGASRSGGSGGANGGGAQGYSLLADQKHETQAAASAAAPTAASAAPPAPPKKQPRIPTAEEIAARLPGLTGAATAALAAARAEDAAAAAAAAAAATTASIGSIATPQAPAATATEISRTAFGEYIAQKWAQVNRAGKPTY